MLTDLRNEKLDIIILAGQSNSMGAGSGEADDPFEPNADILLMERNFTIGMAQERWFNNRILSCFGFSFAREYIKNGNLRPGRKILLVKAAEGGTTFVDNHWGVGDEFYEGMIKMTNVALGLNPENRLLALLWHQGENDIMAFVRREDESDGALKEIGEWYYAKLKTLVETARETFGIENLPFVAGDYSYDWKEANPAACEAFKNATKSLCADISNAGFVETDGLTSNAYENNSNDTVHFSRRALYPLGARYYEKYCGITK